MSLLSPLRRQLSALRHFRRRRYVITHTLMADTIIDTLLISCLRRFITPFALFLLKTLPPRHAVRYADS